MRGCAPPGVAEGDRGGQRRAVRACGAPQSPRVRTCARISHREPCGPASGPPRRGESLMEPVAEVFGRARLLTGADRALYLEQACARDAALRREVESLLALADGPVGITEELANVVGGAAGTAAADPGAIDAVIGAATVSKVDDLRMPVPEALPERIGPYRVLACSARAGWAPSTRPSSSSRCGGRVALKVIRLRDGLARGRRPLRGRAPGAGAHGPPAHRARARRGRHRRRPPVASRWSWCAGVPDHRYCDAQPPDHARAARALPARLPGGPARAPEGRHPPRPQAVATSWWPSATARPSRKVIDFGVAKATGAAADRRVAADAARPGRRHARRT